MLGVTATVALVFTSLGGAAFAATDEATINEDGSPAVAAEGLSDEVSLEEGTPAETPEPEPAPEP